MFNSIRLTFGILVILLIAPQTPTENNLLRLFYNSQIFSKLDYGQKKKFLNLLTWFCTFTFLILTLIKGFN